MTAESKAILKESLITVLGREYTVLAFALEQRSLKNGLLISSLFMQGTYKSTCISSNMLRCEVGDLSGKHAMLTIGSGKEFYTDPDLPLFGEMSGKKQYKNFYNFSKNFIFKCVNLIDQHGTSKSQI